MNTTILQSIGWALIHSVWQSALLFVLYKILAKVMSKSPASLRYTLSLITLGLVFASFVFTAALLIEPERSQHTGAETLVVLSTVAGIRSATESVAHWLTNISMWIDQNLLWVLRIWFMGSLICMLRILSGVAYLYFLRKNALLVVGTWEEKLRGLSGGLGISRQVMLAEARVSTPIVIGFLKPVVLFPIGLMSGLTSEQIESILIHELAHIRRHDFVVNLFQCVMESVFFFNPLVWMLSSEIRILREHCCDDIVLNHGVAPLAYAKTLAYVEEAGVERMFAPAFTGQKNQLLDRMKRIMEKSIVRKEWGRMKLLPLGLALVGLVCASWLSIGTESPALQPTVNPAAIVADTSIHQDEEKQAEYFLYRKDSEDEHRLLEELSIPDDAEQFALAMPLPDYNVFIEDSIPGFLYAPNRSEWEAFEKEFTEKFRQQFHEFFEKNEGQFEKMMEELRQQHGDRQPFKLQMDGWSADKLREMENSFSHANPSFPNMENFVVPDFHQFDKSWEEVRALNEVMRLTEQARSMTDMMRDESNLLRMNEDLLRQHEWQVQDQKRMFEEYEKALMDQLVEDGYLKKGEKARDIRIQDDEVTVNGKKIKESDQKKYKELREKYKPRWSAPHRPE